MDLVQAENLCITYHTAGQCLVAVRHASFTIRSGEVVGILGESGSGKTTLALALARMLPAGARYESGTIRFRGADLLRIKETEMAALRGAQIAIIWQDPALALNPVMRVGTQITEVLRAHGCRDKRERLARAHALLADVGFPLPGEVASAYPHQLSGGQRQRVAIAQALCCRPALVIADEPTSKLDAVLQLDILALLKRLRERHGMAYLIISHDPAVFAGWAGRLLVMYSGEIVEAGTSEQVFAHPLHPYSRALVQLAAAELGTRRRLPVIAGDPPGHMPLPGCTFEPRCPERMALCAASRPAPTPQPDNRQVSCFKYD